MNARVLGALAWAVLSLTSTVAFGQADPTADLKGILDQGETWLWDIASGVGVLAAVAVPLLAFAGILKWDHVKYYLAIAAMVAVLPQLAKFIFDTLAPT